MNAANTPLLSHVGGLPNRPRPPAGPPQSTTEAVCTPVGDEKQHRNHADRTDKPLFAGSLQQVISRCGCKRFTTQTLFRGRFYKMPVPKQIIVGLQKERKPGWLNVSALFEKNHRNLSRNKCDRRRLPAKRGN